MMKGKNELTINKETLMEWAEYYMRTKLFLNVRKIKVTDIQQSTSTFKITFIEKDENIIKA